jgi:hypothetical protein
MSSAPHQASSPYTLRISRLTIDKLGVKLYDKASAVVAELIANSYDADADNVWVELPLGTELASKDPETGEPIDRGYEVVVEDDGHGMTPEEAINFYLKVGRDRRVYDEQGSYSRSKLRPVMGRKGIGKLAPFGICRRIEVISSGGDPIPGQGYLTTHFFLDFNKIIKDTDEPVPLDAGDLDGTYQADHGTTIRLTSFLSKRVPVVETFERQIAVRFAFADPEFNIHLTDTRGDPPEEYSVAKYDVPVNETTRVDVSTRPVIDENGQELAVSGWLAMAKESHKHEELAGVRIYSRGKIAATTRDFEQPAGFTGEFTMRSYLVGEVVADWLDEKEDLIRTDRQSILWDSDLGRALREWGAVLIKEIAAKSVKPRRDNKTSIFMSRAKIKERASERYGDQEVVEAAVMLGKQIGAFAAEDELDDPSYVDDLAEVILTVAPHQALVDAFKTISKQQDATIEELIVLFGKGRVAELASYSQIASERVKSIKELIEVLDKPDVDEGDLQHLIASAPWLIHSDWSVLTQNQPLKTFRDRFTAFWKQRFREDVEIAISFERKRPDFTLVQHGNMLHVVEIKAPGHRFSAADYTRLENYVIAFDEFFDKHKVVSSAFPGGWRIELVADGVNLTGTQKIAFQSFITEHRLIRQTWEDFLAAATRSHEEFLDVYDQAHADGEE